MSEFIHNLVDVRLLNDGAVLLVSTVALVLWTVFLLCVAFRENRLDEKNHLQHRKSGAIIGAQIGIPEEGWV
jgi:hypothetical protein